MHFDIRTKDDERRRRGRGRGRESTVKGEAGRRGRYRPGIKQDHNRVTEEKERKGNSCTQSVKSRS